MQAEGSMAEAGIGTRPKKGEAAPTWAGAWL